MRTPSNPPPDIDRVTFCFFHNVTRANLLFGVSKKLTGYTQKAETLRGAIVLLHAALDDLLRGMLRIAIRSSPETLIEEVPLYLGGKSLSKFSMEILCKFKGRTIEEVIDESIDAHVYDQSYNNTRQIAQLLKNLNINANFANQYFPMIASLSERRHQIVHNSDRNTHLHLLRLPKAEWDNFIRQKAAVLFFGRDVLNNFTINLNKHSQWLIERRCGQAEAELKAAGWKSIPDAMNPKISVPE